MVTLLVDAVSVSQVSVSVMADTVAESAPTALVGVVLSVELAPTASASGMAGSVVVSATVATVASVAAAVLVEAASVDTVVAVAAGAKSLALNREIHFQVYLV